MDAHIVIVIVIVLSYHSWCVDGSLRYTRKRTQTHFQKCQTIPLSLQYVKKNMAANLLIKKVKSLSVLLYLFSEKSNVSRLWVIVSVCTVFVLQCVHSSLMFELSGEVRLKINF